MNRELGNRLFFNLKGRMIRNGTFYNCEIKLLERFGSGRGLCFNNIRRMNFCFDNTGDFDGHRLFDRNFGSGGFS
jgi:hypothetical protein